MNEIIPGVPAALMERMSFLLKRAYALLEDAIELGSPNSTSAAESSPC